MPPLPSVPNVIRLAFKGTSSELNWENVLHYSYSGPAPTVAACVAIATAWWNEATIGFPAEMPPAAHMDLVTVTDLSSSSGAQGSFGTPTDGTRTGGLLPASVAVLADYPSSFRYRGGHPRSYIFAGVQTDLTDQSTWGSAFVTPLQSVWQLMLASIVGTAFSGTTITEQCAVSYYSAGARRVTPLVMPIPSDSATLSLKIASQRRRMRRRT